MENAIVSHRIFDGHPIAKLVIGISAALFLCSAAIIIASPGGEKAPAELSRVILVTIILAAIAACTLELFLVFLYHRHRERSFAAEHARLAAGSVIDLRTGLNNRKYIDDRLESECDRCRRTASIFSCALVDLDNLPAIAAKFGPAQGEAVLRKAATILKQRFRSYDLIGHYDDHRFLLILPGAGIDEVMKACERLQWTLEQNAGEGIGAERIEVAVSFGVATYTEGDEQGDDLLHRAEEALGRTKNGGGKGLAPQEGPRAEAP